MSKDLEGPIKQREVKRWMKSLERGYATLNTIHVRLRKGDFDKLKKGTLGDLVDLMFTVHGSSELLCEVLQKKYIEEK